jgi:hypothetical protein
VQISFQVTNGVKQRVDVSTRSGIVFSRAFLIHDGKGVVTWRPTMPGWAEVLVRARGHQDQLASATLRISVAPRPPAVKPPGLTLLKVPDQAKVGRGAVVMFRATDCRDALAQIEAPGQATRVWRFSCPAPRAKLTWTPTKPDRYLITVIARGEGTTTEATSRLTVERSR